MFSFISTVAMNLTTTTTEMTSTVGMFKKKQKNVGSLVNNTRLCHLQLFFFQPVPFLPIFCP